MYLVYALPGGERLAEGRASSEQSRASTIIHPPACTRLLGRSASIEYIGSRSDRTVSTIANIA